MYVSVTPWTICPSKREKVVQKNRRYLGWPEQPSGTAELLSESHGELKCERGRSGGRARAESY
jgi:hypothetical protein